MTSAPPSRRRIATCLRKLATERGPEKTFCPSEAARRLDPSHWRSLMDPVRKEATHLVKAGHLRCTQRGQEVDPETAPGALRFSLPR